MLSVTNYKQVRTRSTEAAFENAFAARLRKAQVYSRHMSDAIPGLPDRYIRGGMWIEFKSLFRKRGEFTHGEGLSAEQKRTMADLCAAGDRVFYCALLDTGSGDKTFAWETWRVCEGLMGHSITPTQQWKYNSQIIDMIIREDLKRDGVF